MKNTFHRIHLLLFKILFCIRLKKTSHFFIHCSSKSSILSWSIFEYLVSFLIDRSSQQGCSVKKGVLKNFAKFTGKHLCQSLFLNKVVGAACNFMKKETLAQMLSCEFCKIFKNTFLQNTSGWLLLNRQNQISKKSLT